MKHYSKNTDWEDLEEEVEELFFRPFDVAIKKEPTKNVILNKSLWVQPKAFLNKFPNYSYDQYLDLGGKKQHCGGSFFLNITFFFFFK